MVKIAENRPSPIAGQWYPGDAQRLAASVDRYIETAQLPGIQGEVVGVMAPHAGHIYSGPVAGYAFAALRGLTPELVAVVSPMHYPYVEPLLTSAHQAYSTPLGNIPVDHQALDLLDESLEELLGYKVTRIAQDAEHSLEIELPFLQRALSHPFRLLPVMVRDQSAKVAHGLGIALGRLFSGMPPGAGLLVASTDLSHFYTQALAERLDTVMLQQVEAFNPAGIIQIEEQGKAFACGRGALAAVMWAAQELGANRAQVLNHATSGAITGDYQRVVGYGAAVFTRQKSE